MKNRRHLLTMSRDHLIHVLPRLCVGGAYSMICEMVQVFSNYHHTVIHETPVAELDIDVVMVLQAQGADVLQVPLVTPDHIAQLNGSGVILYNVTGKEHAGIGQVIPSIYYAYGIHDPEIVTDVVVPCSAYAASTARDGTPLTLLPDMAVAPIVDTRGLRNIAGMPGMYTVGMLTSGNHNKYPYALAAALVNKKPSSWRLILSVPDQVHEPVLQDALNVNRSNAQIRVCRVKPLGPICYTVHTDVVIYGSAPGYYEPYGRTVVEAMALGKTVICERKGIFGKVLTDRVNTLFFDTPEEAIYLATWLQKDTPARKQLAANGLMWAAWQDASIHAGRLKRVLRMIGA